MRIFQFHHKKILVHQAFAHHYILICLITFTASFVSLCKHCVTGSHDNPGTYILLFMVDFNHRRNHFSREQGYDLSQCENEGGEGEGEEGTGRR